MGILMVATPPGPMVVEPVIFPLLKSVLATVPVMVYVCTVPTGMLTLERVKLAVLPCTTLSLLALTVIAGLVSIKFSETDCPLTVKVKILLP